MFSNNIIQTDEMESLLNDPQGKKMYYNKSEKKEKDRTKMKKIGTVTVPYSASENNQTHTVKNITNFCIKNAVREKYFSGKKIFSDTVIINCENIYSKCFTIKIDYAKFSKYLIKSSFEEQEKDAAFSANFKDALLNKLLFNYIRSIMEEKNTEIPEKAGFNKNGNAYKFISHKDGEYETEIVKQARYTFEIDDDSDIIVTKSEIIKDKLLFMLLILDIASFIYTPLRDIDCYLRKIIVITGCETREKINLLKEVFKVFERNSETLSLNSSLKDIKSIMFSRKDEAVVFEDNVPNKKRLEENISFLINACVYGKEFADDTVECNCIILCNHAHTMEVLEAYSGDILWIDASELNINSDVIWFRNIIRTSLITWLENERMMNARLFKDKNERDVFMIVLHIIDIIFYELFNDVSNTCLSCKEFASEIQNYVEQSKLFYNDEYIIEQFKNALSDAVIRKEISFMQDENSSSIVYVKDDLLLFNVKIFAELEQKIPFGLIDKTLKTTGIRLRTILNENGYLVTNNGDKLLYKTSVSKNLSERANFIALRKSLLTEEARCLVPIVKNKVISTVEYQPPDDVDNKQRIFLGITMDMQKPVYWSIENSRLSNKHLYIQADSGSGKTTLLFLLAQRLNRAKKKVIILDLAEKTSYSKTDIENIDKGFMENTGCSVYEQGFSENEILRYEYSEASIEKIFSNDNICVVRSMPKEAVEILRNIFNWLNSNNENHEYDTYVILDEINSLYFNGEYSKENSQSVVEVVFRQGRSIGLNLISATQFLAKKDSRNKSALFNQSATRIAMHMNSATSTQVAKSINNSNYVYYKGVLEKLTCGQGVIYSGVELDDGSITNDMPLQIEFVSLNK